MFDAQALTPEQRRQTAETLCAQVRSWLEDPQAAVEVVLERGLDVRQNAATGDDELRPNGSATLILHVNGGAAHSTGPAVIPVPGSVVG